jgi:hypothetical protein
MPLFDMLLFASSYQEALILLSTLGEEGIVSICRAVDAYLKAMGI